MRKQKRAVKNGAYLSVTVLAVIAVLILVNLLAEALTQTSDLTEMNTYSLSEETLSYLDTVDTDVTLYYVTESGKESVLFTKLCELFAASTSHIHMAYKDPVQYPQFIYQYNGVNDEIHSNSVILINDEEPDRFVYIDYEDMCVYRTYVDSSTGETTKTLYGYDAESELVKGLIRITGASSKKVYFTTGHGEEETVLENNGEVSESLSDLLALNRLSVSYLSLKTVNEVPDDCALLILGGLTGDLTEEEVTVLTQYRDSGGKICVFLYFGSGSMPNLTAFLENSGISVNSGVLCESNSEKTQSDNACYVLSDYENGYCYWPLGCALTVSENLRSTAKAELLVSTDTGYVKSYSANELARTDEPLGTYGMLIRVTDEFEGVSSEVVAFNTSYFLNEKQCLMTGSAYENKELFLDILEELVGEEESISIPVKLDREEALVISSTAKKNLEILFFGVIPGVFLAAGIVVALRRRR